MLCYFLDIKHHLFNAFYLQTDSQTKKVNSIRKAYLQAFVNFEQNHWAKLFYIAKFAYNNTKNANTGHTLFKLNCNYHPYFFFEEDTNPRSQSKSADKLSAELQDLMIVCQENLHHAQKLQKQVHNKGVKPRNHASSDKVWLNSKYIKTKQHQKLETKFFRLF